MKPIRDLKASEVEIRIGQVYKSGKGLTLLIYKNARVDMDILDETFTPDGWQRDHKEIKDTVYCGISIYDKEKGCWVTKWDAGAESNVSSEKGEASDSFKRAGVNWGIGRELYTGPKIKLWAPKDCKIEMNEQSKKYECDDEFCVESMTVENKKITGLKIRNRTLNRIVFNYTKEEQVESETDWEQAKTELLDKAKELGFTPLQVEDCFFKIYEKPFLFGTVTEYKTCQKKMMAKKEVSK